MSGEVFVDHRLPDESPELMEVLREMAATINVLAGRVFVCTGSPEGKIAADKGSLALRTDGGAGTSFYIKESGAGLATGWVGK
jgi:hypothetical protein